MTQGQALGDLWRTGEALRALGRRGVAGRLGKLGKGKDALGQEEPVRHSSWFRVNKKRAG